ncbi:sphingosine kinase [Polychaeton citri CBS 116435]|uniref:Sphingosine kinase n=1 Tax=Polychaeton citri CBS 116435 TaxID=1314669 RepID=A0A9P4QB23_9PEZI|nr:sphingosine kinase [Polychaeton citri CBS 116435]
MSANSSPINADTSNPFDDHADVEGVEHNDHNAGATLYVDRNVTLTIGSDCLVLLDEGLRERREVSDCCGILRKRRKNTHAVPYYNVLWAKVQDSEITISYAHVAGNACRVRRIHYVILDKTIDTFAQRWVQRLLDRAYPQGCTRRKRIKVLINPFGGQGRAQKIWTRDLEPVLAAANCDVDAEKTGYRGHAGEIAEKLDVEAFDVVGCASGDGIPHEVFNGLARRADAKRALREVAVCQFPCGSGNGMSLNCCGTDSPSLAALAIVKGINTPLDLTAITQGDKTYYSFLSQSVGIIAETDLGTESLRWMGSFRFTWGLLVRLLGKTVYPAELSVAVETSDKSAIREAHRKAREQSSAAHARGYEEAEQSLPPLKYGTVRDPMPEDFKSEDQSTLGNFWVGNMCWMSPDVCFFSAALPADGKMDMVTIDGNTPRLESLAMMTAVEKGTIMDFDCVNYRKVSGYRINPLPASEASKKEWRKKIVERLGGAGNEKVDGYISIDGERVPYEAYQAEIVPGLATVLCKHAGVFEFDGPK